MSGIEGREFREVIGPVDCCAADSPRAMARFKAQRAAAVAQGTSPAASLPPGGGAAAAGGGGGAAAAAGAGAGQLFGGLNVEGLSILKPPYGTIAAVNLDRGEITWRIAHGDTPDNVRNHPALKGLNIPKTGQAGTQASA